MISFMRFVIGVALFATLLVAHPSSRVKQEELHVFRDRAVLFLVYEITEPSHVSSLRDRFDRDADRMLSRREREEVTRYLQEHAIEELRVYLDGEALSPEVKLRATHGLDRSLPSGYPVTFYWQIDFEFPFPLGGAYSPEQPAESADPHPAWARTRVIRFQDSERRWNSSFQCRVRLAPGVEEEGNESDDPRLYSFDHGAGSFEMRVRASQRRDTGPKDGKAVR